jgi:hypothetical protein
MPQAVSPGAVALPCALQLIVPDVVSAPSAVPVSFRSPAHVALNAPLAVVLVCSEGDHLKSVQVVGDGMMLLYDQLPIRAPMPAAEGPVAELLCSNPTQPDTISDNAATRIVFFIGCISRSAYRADAARHLVSGEVAMIPVSGPGSSSTGPAWRARATSRAFGPDSREAPPGCSGMPAGSTECRPDGTVPPRDIRHRCRVCRPRLSRHRR